MASFVSELKSDLKRTGPGLVTLFILEFAARLFEHRILSAVNDFIDAHSSTFFASIKPMLVWFVETPLALPAAAISLILLHAYFKSESELGRRSDRLPRPKIANRFVSVRQEANPAISVSPTTNPSQVVNANPKIEIHHHLGAGPPSAARFVGGQTEAERAQPNIVMCDVAATYADAALDIEHFSAEKESFLVVKACFHNRSVVGRRGVNFDYVQASVSFKNDEGTEVAFTDSPKWFHHKIEESVHIEFNHRECLILAVQNPQLKEWLLPFGRFATGDDGTKYKELSGRSIALGELTVTITLTSDDNFGLAPYTIKLELMADGKVHLHESTEETTRDIQPIPAQIPDSHPHNVLFLGGTRYAPAKHGLIGMDFEAEHIRMVLAEFRNKHIVGSTVGTVRDVQAGITYQDESGKEILYLNPAEWLRRNTDTVKLGSGAESEFVVLAVYNYIDKRWECHKVIRVRQYRGPTYQDEPRPLPFGTITAQIVLLEADGTALKGGTVMFELKENGEFDLK
jgi:hypothetical protein